MLPRTVARALGAALALSATALLPFAHPLLAQEAPRSDRSVRLADVLRQVHEANPVLRAARLGADALATDVRQVSALPDPAVGVTYQPLPVLTARGAQRTQWRVEQVVPFPGKRALQGEIAGLSADVAASEADVLAADLVLEAKQAYYALYRSRQTEALVEDFQDELRRFEEAATVRYEVGEGAQQAVLQAQLEKQRLAERLIGLQVQQRQAAQTLARLTNRPGDIRRFQEVVLERPPVPGLDAARLVAVALERRPEADVLDAATARADRQVALAKKAFLPDLGLSLTYFDIADADVPPSATGRDALALGAMVKVPLQRGRLRAQLEEARLRQAEVEARQEALRTRFETEIEDLRYALEQEAQTLELYQTTLLPQAATTVEASRAAYTTGRADFLSLLDAERSRFTLRTGYEEARYRYLETAARLERALGVTALDEVDVRLTRNALEEASKRK